MALNSGSDLERQIGLVKEALPGLAFKVSLGENKEIMAYLAGKMKLHRIRILPGDRVMVELSPDGRRGRIIRRL